MTPAEIAKKLLEFYAGDASRWTQGSNARSSDGYSVGWSTSMAVCWCLRGAALATGACDEMKVGGLFEDFLRGDCLVEWNDTPDRTFADVEAKLKEIAGVP